MLNRATISLMEMPRSDCAMCTPYDPLLYGKRTQIASYPITKHDNLPPYAMAVQRHNVNNAATNEISVGIVWRKKVRCGGAKHCFF